MKRGGTVSEGPSLVAVARSLPVHGAAVVAAAWIVMVGIGLSDRGTAVVATCAGLACVVSVMVACRSRGVHCGTRALLVGLATLAGGVLAVVLEPSGIQQMVLVLIPGPMCWVVCWPGDWGGRLNRLGRLLLAIPLAGVTLLGMFAVPAPPALLILGALSLGLCSVVGFVRWGLQARMRFLALVVGFFGLVVGLASTVEARISLGTGVVMAELAAWLAASLVLVLVTAWPRLPPSPAVHDCSVSLAESPPWSADRVD